MSAPALRLYNTLTRTKEEFRPIDPSNVRMYVCGPTVYDFAHIGNARPVIVFDVLNRLLRHLAKQGAWDGGKGETKVTYVRNITDVDDKINARAARDFPGVPLNDAIRQVTEKTANQFFADVRALGCLDPDVQPRATDNIVEMVAIINKLLANGCAYIATGSEGREVLFEIGRMKDYGALSKRNLDDQQAGARIAVEGHKRNPGDFVLWKESAPTEPGWHAEFQSADAGSVSIFGRPGWHIECSAMSHRYLGETFDIHGGGLDLIFPHHENEIAQSRCAFGQNVMANVWMHNGFLQVEGEKMSKSLGNFVTINELLETEKFGGLRWDGRTIRFAMLGTHYRQPIDWTQSKLLEAAASLNRFKAWTDHVTTCDNVYPPFIDALMDDLNTPKAIAELHALLNQVNSTVQIDADAVLRQDMLCNSLGLLGVGTLAGFGVGADPELSPSTRQEIETLISTRLEARKAKNFAESDRIRDELAAMGIQLKDGKDSATGEPTTMWEVKR